MILIKKLWFGRLTQRSIKSTGWHNLYNLDLTFEQNVLHLINLCQNCPDCNLWILSCHRKIKKIWMFTAQEVFWKIKAKSFTIYSKYSSFSLFSIKRSVSFSCVHEIFILDWNIDYLSIVAEDTVSFDLSILNSFNPKQK